jgi:hypothetical protein
MTPARRIQIEARGFARSATRCHAEDYDGGEGLRWLNRRDGAHKRCLAGDVLLTLGGIAVSCSKLNPFQHGWNRRRGRGVAHVHCIA